MLLIQYIWCMQLGIYLIYQRSACFALSPDACDCAGALRSLVRLYQVVQCTICLWKCQPGIQCYLDCANAEHTWTINTLDPRKELQLHTRWRCSARLQAQLLRIAGGDIDAIRLHHWLESRVGIAFAERLHRFVEPGWRWRLLVEHVS